VVRRATGVRAAAVGTVAVLAVLWPVVRGRGDDSFPLSNYPMFTGDHPAETSFVRAIGVDDAGGEEVLPPEVAGGTVEVIHTARTLRRAIGEGRAAELCADIAERAPQGFSHVLIVVERYDVVTALRAEYPEPIRRDVHAECEVDL
jgi:hypothetical protein